MLHRPIIGLRRAALVTGSSLLSTALVVGCGQAKFGSDSQTSGAKKTKGGLEGDNYNDGDGVPNGVDAQAYGTPPSSDITKPGWAEGEKFKSLVDTLFREGSLPTLGDAPLGGQSEDNTRTLGGNDGGKTGQSDAGGNDGGSKGGLFTDASGVLWMPCKDPAQSAGDFKSDFYARKGAKVRVAGEFCPQAKLTGDVTVLFVIDHSGSMEGGLFSNEGPNDKTSGGSCGRLRSAQVIATKFKAMADTKVQAGVVNFASNSRTEVNVGPLANLPLTEKVFCGSDAAGMTNYHAAFTEAAKAIANVPGKKLVYFVSDGSPTTGPTKDHRASGLEAAQALRKIPDVTLFALFVGYKGGVANNPQGYLEQITGDPKAVRVTANAEELVKAAAALSQPIINIKPEDVVASVKKPDGSADVKIEKIEARKDVPNRFYWVTEPFELSGSVDQAELNELSIVAKTSTGDKVTTTAEITFNQQKP